MKRASPQTRSIPSAANPPFGSGRGEELDGMDAGHHLVPREALTGGPPGEVDERLAGDAAVVEAFAAEVDAFDYRNALAFSTEGTGDVVAGRAVADDDQVVGRGVRRQEREPPMTSRRRFAGGSKNLRLCDAEQ